MYLNLKLYNNSQLKLYNNSQLLVITLKVSETKQFSTNLQQIMFTKNMKNVIIF